MNQHGARRISHLDELSLRFSLDGALIPARNGDTVASALIAAGHRVFTTSPQDGSPRGGFCFSGRCADCLMIIDGQPGTMACMTPVQDGMRVETQQGLGRWSAANTT